MHLLELFPEALVAQAEHLLDARNGLARNVAACCQLAHVYAEPTEPAHDKQLPVNRQSREAKAAGR